jgi:SnoaL-like domain
MLDSFAWLAAYHQAWISRDAEQVVRLFTMDALYQSHPFRSPYRGHAEIQAYWQHATRSQVDLEVRWGTPVVSGKRIVVEWWATMRDTGEGDLTLPGCLLLRFSDEGLCEELREYWHIEVGSHILPPANWGT